jgi:hypothetical protein
MRAGACCKSSTGASDTSRWTAMSFTHRQVLIILYCLEIAVLQYLAVAG